MIREQEEEKFTEKKVNVTSKVKSRKKRKKNIATTSTDLYEETLKLDTIFQEKLPCKKSKKKMLPKKLSDDKNCDDDMSSKNTQGLNLTESENAKSLISMHSQKANESESKSQQEPLFENIHNTNITEKVHTENDTIQKSSANSQEKENIDQHSTYIINRELSKDIPLSQNKNIEEKPHISDIYSAPAKIEKHEKKTDCKNTGTCEDSLSLDNSTDNTKECDKNEKQSDRSLDEHLQFFSNHTEKEKSTEKYSDKNIRSETHRNLKKENVQRKTVSSESSNNINIKPRRAYPDFDDYKYKSSREKSPNIDTKKIPKSSVCHNKYKDFYDPVSGPLSHEFPNNTNRITCDTPQGSFRNCELKKSKFPVGLRSNAIFSNLGDDTTTEKDHTMDRFCRHSPTYNDGFKNDKCYIKKSKTKFSQKKYSIRDSSEESSVFSSVFGNDKPQNRNMKHKFDLNDFPVLTKKDYNDDFVQKTDITGDKEKSISIMKDQIISKSQNSTLDLKDVDYNNIRHKTYVDIIKNSQISNKQTRNQPKNVDSQDFFRIDSCIQDNERPIHTNIGVIGKSFQNKTLESATYSNIDKGVDLQKKLSKEKINESVHSIDYLKDDSDDKLLQESISLYQLDLNYTQEDDKLNICSSTHSAYHENQSKRESNRNFNTLPTAKNFETTNSYMAKINGIADDQNSSLFDIKTTEKYSEYEIINLFKIKPFINKIENTNAEKTKKINVVLVQINSILIPKNHQI
ncbi:hypothetical protein EDEG_03759 [Edhazardia aedis USNM 41457]|uniref:Uncharacterized protein n=1 Tax=Edhazardia aedis (strain USNM 41457) TaxID=1003232 RepID=J9D1K0_EDHAE|nr:hypothetical protein EDEG_03759 [Edhazardia aedis USNM 41457]|eukprot:EJW01716.1 hypothetical protein EDEG_03759 [Edhazardia aedis USNM 41457]